VTNRANRILILQALVCLGFPVVVAFVISSPGQLAFWVILFGVLAVTIPGLAVASWFWRDIRRIERSGSDSPSK
jgi:hypothetical protein